MTPRPAPTKVVVWGNCQAPALADLLRDPLAGHGLQVVPVPPVYLVAEADLARIRADLRECALLVSQPVSDEYRVPGCGTNQLADLLPPRARLVRLPVVYDVGAFPFQVRGYDDVGRVDAPVTDYHDLRTVLAAAGRALPEVPAERLRAVAAASAAELRRREAGLDVAAADLVATPTALWTMTHPTNHVLAELARRILAAVGLDGEVRAPEREYLGQRRAPLAAEVAAARGWDLPDGRGSWIVDGVAVDERLLVDEQLAFYRDRSEVVTATLRRNAPRLELLGVR